MTLQYRSSNKYKKQNKYEIVTTMSEKNVTKDNPLCVCCERHLTSLSDHRDTLKNIVNIVCIWL